MYAAVRKQSSIAVNVRNAGEHFSLWMQWASWISSLACLTLKNIKRMRLIINADLFLLTEEKSLQQIIISTVRKRG